VRRGHCHQGRDGSKEIDDESQRQQSPAAVPSAGMNGSAAAGVTESPNKRGF
jgi:hypothetical protein